MADPDLLRSLDVAALEAEAAIRRDESEAATDLAMSLRQGGSFRDTLRRWGCFEVSVGGAFRPCVEVGRDYIGVDGDVPTLVPLERVVSARAGHGAPPEVLDRDLVSLLRSAVRRRTAVEIEVDGDAPRRLRGTLLQASPDHLVLRAGGTETAFISSVLRVIRLLTRRGERLRAKE